MAEPINQLSQTDKEKLAAFEAREAREKKISEIIEQRRAICGGAIPDAMLRQIAIDSITHDERHAAKAAAEAKK